MNHKRIFFQLDNSKMLRGIIDLCNAHSVYDISNKRYECFLENVIYIYRNVEILIIVNHSNRK